MTSNLKPVRKEPSRALTPLEQTRLAFIRATRRLQDAGKRHLRFASPIRAGERSERPSESLGRIEQLPAAFSL